MTEKKKTFIAGQFGGPRQPTREPDTLNSSEIAKVIDIISEGLTEGFATPSKLLNNKLNSNKEIYQLSEQDRKEYIKAAQEDIFLDDIPIRNKDSESANFNNFGNNTSSLDVRRGSENQATITTMGVLQTEKINPINLKVTKATSRSFDITVPRPSLSSTQSLAPEAVKVTLSTPSLQESNDKGDLLGRKVEYKIFFQYVGVQADPSPTLMFSGAFDGRTGDQYRREHIFKTESFKRDIYKRYPLRITVERITASNDNNDQIQDDIFLSSITEIQKPKSDYQGATLSTDVRIDNGKGTLVHVQDGQFSYPYTAYSFLKFDAYEFQSIPKRTFRYRGVKVRIPLPNNDVTPTVDITGNGRIQYPSDYIFCGEITSDVFWTTDPAFILLDLLLNTRYGFGNYIDEKEVDLFSFFQASKYSAQLVDTPDGKEPRFAFSGVINKSVQAFEIIKQICGVMRCYPIWSGGKLTLVQDRPINYDSTDLITNTTPTYIFSLANTINGFSYSGVSAKTRHGKVVIEYFNMDTRQFDTVVITNNTVFAKTHNIKKVRAFGCTSFYQAVRYGRSILWTENNETDVVTFDVSIESGVVVRPGSVVGINDPVRAGIRRAGRVSAVTLDESGNLTSLTIDDSSSTDLPTVGDRTISILDSAGKAGVANISSISGKVVTLSSPLAPSTNATFQANTVWLIENNIQSQLFRIVDVEEQDGILYKMTGIPYKFEKYANIDLGNDLNDLQNIKLQTTNRGTSILNSDKGGPVDINGVTNLREKQGQVISVFTVSFSNVIGIQKYLVRYKFKRGSVSNQQTNILGQPTVVSNPNAEFGEYLDEFTTEDLIFEIENASVGIYRVEIYSVNAVGQITKSPTIKELTNAGLFAAPSSPTKLNGQINVLSSTLTLTWPLSGDIDVTSNGHVIIKYNSDSSGNASWGDSRLIAIVHGSQTTHTVSLLAGEYLIKYQDQTLVQSDNSVSVIISQADILDKKLIGTIQENTGFSGSKTALTVNNNGMEINQNASNILIDSITAFIDTINDFNTLDGDTGLLEGEYEFSTVLNLGAKFSGVTFESIVKFEGFNDNSSFDTYVPAVILNSEGAIIGGGVDALARFDGDVLENATASVEIQTSDDNSTYTSPNDFIQTTLTGQYFKFKLKLSTTTSAANTRIILGDQNTNTLGSRVLMDSRTETSATLTTSGDQTVASNTLYTFTNGFFVGTNASTGFTAPLPSVTINPLALGTGEFFVVTNISGTGFNVVFKNSSGVPQTGKQFTYTATGFGKKV